ncbi:MAG: hypothetical protein KF836_07490 [Fimbriimonadaceae bacterium]|nr:hypothetical protein [Fimbriimonadaceae bacterium]
MTLILTWLDQGAICQAADRQLTWPDRREDGYNKQSCIQCADGNISIAFTGMAQLGPPQQSSLPNADAYYTDDMIADVAVHLVAGGEPIAELVNVLARCAKYWVGLYWARCMYGTPKRRFLSIVVTGFENGKPFSLEITNAEGAMSGHVAGPERFKIVRHSVKPGKLYVHGARGAWTSELRYRAKLKSRTVITNAPGDRCEQLARFIIESAKSPKANGVIGRSVVAAEIHPNRPVPFDSVYCLESGESFLDYAPNVISPVGNLLGTCTASVAPTAQTFLGVLNKLLPRVV